MSKLRALPALLLLLLLAPICSAQQFVTPVAGVLTVDCTFYSSFKTVVTGNITSVVLTNAKGGQTVSILFQQDATGGHTVAFGGNVAGSPSVSTTANATTVITLQYDASANTWNAIGGGGSVTLPTTLTAPGVFTNTQMNLNLAVNLNGCNPGTAFMGQQSGTFDTEPITGCVAVPSGSTVHQASGVAGFASVSSTSTNGVGVYGQGVCAATGTFCWGMNPLVSDNPTQSGTGFQSLMQGIEDDIYLSNAADTGWGMEITGIFTAQPAMDSTYATPGNFPALEVMKPGTGGKGWTSGFSCAEAAFGPNGACFLAGPIVAGNNVSSHFMFFTATTAGGAHPFANLFENSSSQFEIDNSPFRPIGMIGGGTQNVSGCSLTVAAGGAWAGKFASGIAGTCTVTITPGFTATNGFICEAKDTTTVADVINQTAFTTTTCTISGTTASGDVITWLAIAF